MWRVLCILLCLSPAFARADVTVFAAASLAGPLDEVVAGYEGAAGGQVALVYGASSSLARQVAAGAPADLVWLANEAWMDDLAARGAVEPHTRRAVLGNALVLIGRRDEPDLTLAQLPDVIGRDRLALALTEAVPAGIYARDALETLGVFAALAPNIVESDSVRAALAQVSLGAARFAITYRTDARVDPRVRVLDEISPEAHAAIRYPLALTQGAGPEARALWAYLQSEPALAAFAAAGFEAGAQ